MKIRRTARPRVLVLTTSDETLGAFFGPQLAFLAAAGFDVHAVCSPGPGLETIRRGGAAQVHGVRMERRPHPLRDLLSLVSLWLLILSVRPQIVHSHTPKAGLLGMIAATLALVPVRLYTIHGLPLITRTGWMRRLLVAAERLSCFLATRVYTVSSSLRELALQIGLCSPRKLVTLGDGSCAGLDLGRFDPTVDRERRIRETRGPLEVPADAMVVSFIGRVAHDKGIAVLAEAWEQLAARFPSLYLLVCGAYDSTDPVAPEVLEELRNHPRARVTGEWVKDVPAVYCASDIIVLPTFREGLSQVALEAAAMQVPIVATRIPGLVNSVQDGVTGILVAPSDAAELAAAIADLLEDPDRRRRIGLAGRRFVTEHFSQERVNSLVLADYRGLLDGSNVPLSPQTRTTS